MSDPISTSTLADGRLPDGGKAVQSAFVWALASLATAVAIFSTTLLIWSQSERHAGHMIVGNQRSPAYLPALASQFAALHGRPGRL